MTEILQTPNATGNEVPTLFQLPTVPDEIGILLPPANLRRINFSALDFTLARRAIIEYIQAYFPDTFNDFVASNGAIMIMEVVAAVLGKLGLRADVLFREAFLPSAQSTQAIVNHLALIGQSMRRQTPASVNVQASVNNVVATDINIVAGTKFTLVGPDKLPVFYEIYRAPGDFTSDITIPAGKNGVIAYGIEGTFAGPFTYISPGGPGQTVTVNAPNMLEAPLIVAVTTGNTTVDWTVITTPIEQFGPNDQVVEVTFLGGNVTFTFGDDINGKALLAGQTVAIRYRVGGGTRGRIGLGKINEQRQLTPDPPANAPTSVTFTNITAAVGGTDAETNDQARVRGPRDFATHDSAVTDSDYTVLASDFSHPVFGTILKAVATVRTDINTNLVELYVLAIGDQGQPVTAPLGLKQALTTYLDNLNVLTDQISVLDAVLHPVDVSMTIVVHKNADATVVQQQVEAAITSFFDVSNWALGEPLYVSNLIEIVEAIDGVAYVDLFSPGDNLLAIVPGEGGSNPGIAFNELVVEGSRQTKYYYEQGHH